jgi:hypothetical protein
VCRAVGIVAIDQGIAIVVDAVVTNFSGTRVGRAVDGIAITSIGNTVDIGIDGVISAGTQIATIGHPIAIGVDGVIRTGTDIESVTDTIRVGIRIDADANARFIATVVDGARIAVVAG